MYINENEKKNDMKDNEEDDDALGKFYEERVMFFENEKDSGSCFVKGNNNNTNKTMERCVDNEMKKYKNVESGNIITYDKYKHGVKSKYNNNNNENHTTKNKRSKTLNNYRKTTNTIINNNNNNNTKSTCNNKQNLLISTPKAQRAPLVKHIFTNENEPHTTKAQNITTPDITKTKKINYDNNNVSAFQRNNNSFNQNIFKTSSTNASLNLNTHSTKQFISYFPRKFSSPFRPTIFTSANTTTNPNNSQKTISLLSHPTNNEYTSSLSKKQPVKLILDTNQYNDIRNIIDKRQQQQQNKILSTKLNESTLSTKTTTSNSIYERSKLYKQKSIEKINKIKNELALKETEECRFKPKLTKKSSQILNDSISYRSYNLTDDFYKKNVEWKNNRDKTIKSQSRRIEQMKYEECSFYPNASDVNKYKQLKTEVRSKENDYMYKKNMEWLNRIEKNKERDEKERISEMKYEMERIAKENKKRIDKHLNRDRSVMSHKESIDYLAQPKSGIYCANNNNINNIVGVNDMKRSMSFTSSKNTNTGLNTIHQNDSQVDINGPSDNIKLNKQELNDIKMLLSSLKESLNVNKQMKMQFQ